MSLNDSLLREREKEWEEHFKRLEERKAPKPTSNISSKKSNDQSSK